MINYAILPLVSEWQATQDLRRDFAQADAALGPAIKDLGVVSEGKNDLGCTDERRSHWQTESYCYIGQSYKYINSPLTEAKRQAYPANAKKLDDLLSANGWVSDRPHDKFVTAVQIDPYSPANNGQGGMLVFHKNIGSVSCNLRIDYSGHNSELTTSPDALNVDGFTCQKAMTYPKFSIFNYKYEGA